MIGHSRGQPDDRSADRPGRRGEQHESTTRYSRVVALGKIGWLAMQSALPGTTPGRAKAPHAESGTAYVGKSVNSQGNERSLRRREAGRLEDGTSTARFFTGINPRNSVTGAPTQPSGDQGG